MQVDPQSGIFASAMHDETKACDPVDDRIPVTVEVCMKPGTEIDLGAIKGSVERFLRNRYLTFEDHEIVMNKGDAEGTLLGHVHSIRLCDTVWVDDDRIKQGSTLFWWQFKPQIYIYQLHEGGGEDDDDEEDEADCVPSFCEWALPSRDLDGIWDALHYDTKIKQRLLHYAQTALLFADRGVKPSLVCWNRVVLLHGEPGCGKTSLCKALAQKLTIRFSERFTAGSRLIEVNAHSLFSKYFSESGKLVLKLFTRIKDMLEDENSLVFVLIDEVESLAAVRKARSNDPSDAIRAVNALLTQLDNLKNFPNVMVLATSNLAGSIDLAFVDRADIKAYIGPPSKRARYEILRSCIVELHRAGIIGGNSSGLPLSFADYVSTTKGEAIAADLSALTASGDLDAAATESENFSGRCLRKLPFLAHASNTSLACPCACVDFIAALRDAISKESQEKEPFSATEKQEGCA